MAKRGRPPIPKDDVQKWQSLYLDLLSAGQTEIEINAVEGMPCWDTRYAWKVSDDVFSARRHRAQMQGVEFKLRDAEKRLEYAYDRAVEDSASPQLVTAADKIAQHARWKASKLNRDDYGEKSTVEQTGKDGGAIKQDITFRWQNDDDSNPV